jgi:hypothetical protein
MTDMGRNVPADQAELLAGNYEELLQRQKELLEAANRAPKVCEDDETAKKLTDFVGQMAACIAAAMKAHRVEKEPHLRAGQTVDEFFRDIRAPLLTFKQTFEGLIGGWQFRKQEAERLAAIEAERLAMAEMERLAAAAETESDLEDAIAQEDAALEAAAIAAARPLERSRIHGDLATGSLRIEYEYEIVDLARVPRSFMMLNESAVKRHIAARPQDGEPAPVPGLRFTPVHKARIRA